MWFIHLNIFWDLLLFVNEKPNWNVIHEEKKHWTYIPSHCNVIRIIYVAPTYLIFHIHQHCMCKRQFLFICNIFTINSVCSLLTEVFLAFVWVYLLMRTHCGTLFKMEMNGKRQTNRQSKYEWEWAEEKRNERFFYDCYSFSFCAPHDIIVISILWYGQYMHWAWCFRLRK